VHESKKAGQLEVPGNPSSLTFLPYLPVDKKSAHTAARALFWEYMEQKAGWRAAWKYPRRPFVFLFKHI